MQIKTCNWTKKGFQKNQSWDCHKRAVDRVLNLLIEIQGKVAWLLLLNKVLEQQKQNHEIIFIIASNIRYLAL